jgi:predicted NBD/HSP70 family sugar kinase
MSHEKSWVPGPSPTNAVALEILRFGPLSRTDIARRLGLSTGSITRLSTPLVDQGLIAEQGAAVTGRAGRPSRPLEVVADARHFVGLKLTGDHIFGVLTDLKTEVTASTEARLRSTDPEGVVEQLAEVITELSSTTRTPSAVGVALGGRVRDGVVTSAPFLDWQDVDLRGLLERRQELPVAIENDLISLTAAEHWFGAGRGLDRFAVVTVGAGVGYGLVMQGEVIDDDDAGIGLLGHFPIDPHGPVCPEGHRGCAHAMLTIWAIEQNVSAALGRHVGFDDAVLLAQEGQPAARRIVDDAARGFGRMLAVIANLTMPQRIVLGGEGVRFAEIAAPALHAGIAEVRDRRASALQLTTIAADNRDWCRGAAAVAIQRFVGTS